jgi:site-specific DNA-adenine methylase
MSIPVAGQKRVVIVGATGMVGGYALRYALDRPGVGCTKVPLPDHAAEYPELRYMGSKHRLLPWIHGVLRGLNFETAADPFVGSGCVAYLLKTMGKRVIASDFLNFPAVLAAATVGNSKHRLDGPAVKSLLAPRSNGPNFIEKTFDGIFYTPEDLRFLDRVSANTETLECPHQQALARAALMRSCLKKQPRGVFTVSGNLSRYDDGRRDLRLSIEEHFLEQVEAFNRVVFDNGRRHTVKCADVFSLKPKGVDLVYLDPPYVPRTVVSICSCDAEHHLSQRRGHTPQMARRPPKKEHHIRQLANQNTRHHDAWSSGGFLSARRVGVDEGSD